MMSDEQWTVYHAAREAFLDRPEARVVTREQPDRAGYTVIVEEEVPTVVGEHSGYPIYGSPKVYVTTFVVDRIDITARFYDGPAHQARIARAAHDEGIATA